MTISSLGDWIGLFALLSITDRLAPGNTLAIAGLMIFRVLPAFIIGPLAGVALDRLDRRKAMIFSDISRAVLIAIIPFAHTLPVLYAVSFCLETISLIWMPAKDSLVPTLVPGRWLVAANSMALFSSYGVFPLSALVFTGLVGTGQFLGDHISALRDLQLNQENLALWIDAVSFLASAVLVSRIRFAGLRSGEKRPFRVRAILDELVEGLRYVKAKGEINRVIRGMGIAVAGGAVIFSLGPGYAREVLDAGPKSFGLIVAFLGTGMGAGVLILGFIGDRLPKGWVFALASIAGGLTLVTLAAISNLLFAFATATALGAFAGVATATSFALLQERVDDEVRGRTFASVQIVIRLSLFISLVAFPALAQFFASFSLSTQEGIRLSLAIGGLIGVGAGTLTAMDVYRRRIDASQPV